MNAPITDEEKRRAILSAPASKVAGVLRVRLQWEWNNGGRPHDQRVPTEDERREAVLGHVRDLLSLLMPDHEEKAREIYALVPWPVAASHAPTDFGPVPTFEKLFGRECPTCGGTGVAGFISGQRCPHC